MPDDLTPEEREECLQDYLEEFRKSTGSATAELTCRIKLGKLGIDREEINYLIRMNRP